MNAKNCYAYPTRGYPNNVPVGLRVDDCHSPNPSFTDGLAYLKFEHCVFEH